MNFRLDVSRVHAEWLVEQKSEEYAASVWSVSFRQLFADTRAEYDEALTWDQLKIAMKDPSKSPFPGFEEGPINFPPTFKYDVWKSARATNREARRSLRRRNSIKDKAPEFVLDSNLDHVPESGEHERESEDNQPRVSMDSTRSIGRSSAPIDETDEYDRRGTEAMQNGLANSHRPLDVKLKEKTKKVFSLVKLKTALVPSPKKSSGLRSRVVSGASASDKGEKDFDLTSRRTSISSFASMRETELGSPRESEFGESVARMPIDGTSTSTPTPAQAIPRPPHHSTATTAATTLASQTSPPRPRSFSLKRTMSGRSTKFGSSVGSSTNEDTREGVYDSSKKQRVPSWVSQANTNFIRKRKTSFRVVVWLNIQPSAIECFGKHIPFRIRQNRYWMSRKGKSCLKNVRDLLVDCQLRSITWEVTLSNRYRDRRSIQ